MADIVTITQIFVSSMVALGTILLAFFSFKNIKIIREQTKLIFRQSNFLRLQQAPLLKNENLKFDEDEISLKLTNVGNGIATQIGVRTIFCVVEPRIVEPPDDKIKEKILKERGISKETWERITKIFGREPWLKYTLSHIQKIFEEKSKIQRKIFGLNLPFSREEISKAYPEDYNITFLKENGNGPSILEVGKSGVFKCIPQIVMKIGEPYLSGKKFTKYWQKLSFENLVRLCKDNSIKFLGFKFDLEYKDFAEDTKTPEELTSCVVDVNHHKSLEEAVKENTQLDFFPLGQPEIEKKLGGTLGFSYYETKWNSDLFY